MDNHSYSPSCLDYPAALPQQWDLLAAEEELAVPL
jgi:hypothetical protein